MLKSTHNCRCPGRDVGGSAAEHAGRGRYTVSRRGQNLSGQHMQQRDPQNKTCHDTWPVRRTIIAAQHSTAGLHGAPHQTMDSHAVGLRSPQVRLPSVVVGGINVWPL